MEKLLPIFVLIMLNILCSTLGQDRWNIVLNSYNIELKPNMDNMTFQGNVSISLSMLEKVEKIRLRTHRLEIIDVEVTMTSLGLDLSNQWEVHDEDLKIKVKVPPGNYTITVSYTGHINQSPSGFFKTNCYSGKNISWLSGAILEPANARSVFPSFDLNSNRTQVNLTLTLNSGLDFITSRPSQISKLQSGEQIVSVDFGKINVNQIGWAIYPRGTLNRGSSDGHVITTCRETWDGVKAASNADRAMGEYTGRNLNWTQWVALPDLLTPIASSDNITFIREHLIESSNYTTLTDSDEDLMSVAEAFSQQWLGEIITVFNWSDLWLTKGLTNFFRYKLANKIKPAFNQESHIVGSVLPRVLERDSLNRTRSLSRHDYSKQDILSFNDQDLFDKAGLIMRMLEDLVGEVNFKKAIFCMFNGTHHYHMDIAHVGFFWSCVRNETGSMLPGEKPVNEIMNAWIHAPGYPLLEAKRTGNNLVVKQKSINRHSRVQWWVPVSITTQSMRSPKRLWLRPNGQITHALQSKDHWYMINEKGKGYYRVNYDIDNWHALSQAVSVGDLNGLARARLLDDSLALAELNQLQYSIGLGFTRHLAREFVDREPWEASVRHLLTARNILGRYMRSEWDAYVSTLVKCYVLGQDLKQDNSTLDFSQRELNISSATYYKLFLTRHLCRNNPHCSDMIQSFTSQTNMSWNGDMLDGILCFKIEEQSENSTYWQNWLDEYKLYKSPSYERKIIRALACTEDKTQMDSYMNMLLYGSGDMKKQDLLEAVNEISYSEDGAIYLINMLTSNPEQMMKLVEEDPLTLDILIPISERVYDAKFFEITRLLFKMLEEGNMLPRNIDRYQIRRAFDRMNMSVNRRKTCSREIANWLSNVDDPTVDFDESSAILRAEIHPLLSLSISLFFTLNLFLQFM